MLPASAERGKPESAVQFEVYELSDTELIDVLVDDPGFAEFIGTFDGLEATEAELSVAASADAAAAGRGADNMPLNDNAMVQLNALYSLYVQGVEDANRWIEETTIDSSGYENMWYMIDFENDTSGYYFVTNAGIERVEPSFAPNPPEVRAIRQALLAPYSIVNIREMSGSSVRFEDLLMPLAIGPGITPYPFWFLTNPVSAIGELYLHYRIGNVTHFGTATAFLICTRLGLTSGHVLRIPSATGLSFNLQLLLLNPFHFRTVSNAWVHTRWSVNQDPQYDKGIIGFSAGTFPGAGSFMLRTSSPGNNPPAPDVQIIGIAAHHSGESPAFQGRQRWSFGDTRPREPHWTLPGGNVFYSHIFTAPGMSGSPVMSNFDGRVLGINSGTALALAVTVRITPAFNTQINVIRQQFGGPPIQ